MATQNWIPLVEYSTRYNISLSTLRRRIKAHSVLYKLDNGKYFILDDSSQMPLPDEPPAQQAQLPPSEISVESNTVEASVLASAHRLVDELKAAYAKILQEKEVQIGLLKEQILDLNMLVSILEKQITEGGGTKTTNAEQKQNSEELSQGLQGPDVEKFYFQDIES